MIKPAIITATDGGADIAARIATALGGEVVGRDAGVAHTLRNTFLDARPIIAVMAAGAVIRMLAPLLADKQSEPPVVCVSEDGSAVVPLLGGHHGANILARRIGELLNAKPAITTAGDLRFGVALDEPPGGWRLTNPGTAKSAMARALAGTRFRAEGEWAEQASWLRDFPLNGDGESVLHFTTVQLETDDPVFAPQVHCVGIGCERGADAAEIEALLRETLADTNISSASIAGVWSIDVKADEAGLAAASLASAGSPVRFFTAERLEEEAPRLANPSDIVFAEVGCHGVAEGAALAAAGKGGELIVTKRKSARATVAIVRAAAPIVEPAGRARGSLAVVGIGPGQALWRSPEVSRMVGAASDLVGYGLYLDLLGPLADGKTRHDYALGAEEERVRVAMELAGEGRAVALVCSGDAGIYAMATLVFELLDSGNLSDGAKRIAIEVSPGISALQAAAARAGAPLGHDFCTISLSDLLTPWEDIKQRVKTAAEGDFVIAFYNPVSRKRRTQLAYARDELLNHRPADTPVILATNLGREGETIRTVPLCELQVDDVDMLTVVIVGSSNTRTARTGEGREWVFTPRGYSAKAGSGLSLDKKGEKV
jgi:cobalt-precorrin 5A hydrolase/precorrin-3B C17-methyltransferase